MLVWSLLTRLLKLVYELSWEKSTWIRTVRGKQCSSDLTVTQVVSLTWTCSYYTETTAQSLADTSRFIEEMRDMYKSEPSEHKHLVEPIITPRFLPTCSKQLLSGLAKIAAGQKVDVQSHLSESGDEVAFTQSIYGEKTDSELFDEVSTALNMALMRECEADAAFRISGRSTH